MNTYCSGHSDLNNRSKCLAEKGIKKLLSYLFETRCGQVTHLSALTLLLTRVSEEGEATHTFSSLSEL